MKKLIPLDDVCMAHRCLYYNGDALISDFEYDRMEKEVLCWAHEKHPLRLSSTGPYTAEQVQLAEEMRAGKRTVLGELL